MVRLLIATRNAGKQREYEQLLSHLPPTVELGGLFGPGLTLEVAETGTTYSQNARLKARAYAQALGLMTLADDSGLEVDALHGEPGILSARYGGDGLSDSDRYRMLLRRLQGVPWLHRSARFCCAVALSSPAGDTHVAEGKCEGMIAFRPAGEHGFGYDPIFYLPEHNASMAELPDEAKNRISHRARAVTAMLPTLQAILADTAGSTGAGDG